MEQGLQQQRRGHGTEAKTIYIEREDTGELLKLNLAAEDERAIAQELAETMAGLGALSDSQAIDFGAKVATALLEHVVQEMILRGLGKPVEHMRCTESQDVTGLNPCLVNLLEALRMWDLTCFLGAFLREGFSLLLPMPVILSITASDLAALGICSMGHRKSWAALVAREGQQAVMRDARVRSSTAGQSYLRMYDGYLVQSSFGVSSSSSSHLAAAAEAKGRSRNRTRKKKAAAAAKRADAAHALELATPVPTAYPKAEEQDPEDDCPGLLADSPAEPEAEPC